MINLSTSTLPSPQIQMLDQDPGVEWVKEDRVAIDSPPDSAINPRPESIWDTESPRTGICGVVSPRVLTLPDGTFRMYYTQILPRPGFPHGANDYDHSTSRILSAVSTDGVNWKPEPGIRLTPQQGGAGDYRVASSEVVPTADGRGLRMYVESCPGSQSVTNSIRSAVSFDGGLEWDLEPSATLESPGHNYAAPRIVFLEGGRMRLYVLDRGHGIVSAISNDGGVTFAMEEGVRIAQDGEFDSVAAFAPEIVLLRSGLYVMYYAGYSAAGEASILRAESQDGLVWQKLSRPVIHPGPGGWDGAKSSEMCLYRLPSKEGHSKYRMVYEACDGTAINRRGVWRIASATSVFS